METSQKELYEFIYQTLNISKNDLEIMELQNAQNYQKFMEKMKRTLRRTKAKQRSIKEEFIIQSQSKKVKKKSKENMIHNDNDKKTIQMIRNRISAQTSRDRKKMYLHQLEEQTKQQLLKNQELKDQLQIMRQKNIDLISKSNRMRNKLQQILLFGGSSKLRNIAIILITLISVFCVVDIKQEENKLVNQIKIEDQSENFQALSYPYDKSFTIYDNNDLLEEKIEEKYEVTEDSENCFHQYQLNPIHRIYQDKNFQIFQNF